MFSANIYSQSALILCAPICNSVYYKKEYDRGTNATDPARRFDADEEEKKGMVQCLTGWEKKEDMYKEVESSGV